jgi:hypothetical protein
MANFYAPARSNYFAVKDEKAFRKWADRLGLTVLEPDHHDKTADGIRRLGIAPGNCGDNGGWPDSTYDEDEDEVDEFDLTEELAPHLADDEVAVLMAVGNEALRYVTGTAVAVNSRGKTVTINLDAIYDAARELGPNITRAEY